MHEISVDKYVVMGPPEDSAGRESACNAGAARDMGSILGLKRSPGEENGNPFQYSGISHGQGSLVSCSPWGGKELDRTEVT